MISISFLTRTISKSLLLKMISKSISKSEERFRNLKNDFSRGVCMFLPPFCQQGLSFGRSSIFGDSFLAVSCQGQIGHFQKLFADLTRIQAQVDYPSVANLLHGSIHLFRDWYKMHGFNPDVIHAISPDLTVSFQQQVYL